MPRIVASVRTAALFCVLCPMLAACAPRTPLAINRLLTGGSASVTVDGAQRFQTIDGFGVNANSLPWDNGALAPAMAQLTDTMGASVWRVIVESTQGWEDTPDTGDVNAFDWVYYDRLYETPKFRALWAVLGYLQQKRVPSIMLNVMGCPPRWMGDCAIDRANEDYYVKMEASLLYYARSVKHVRIDLFSPMNEEDHGNPEGPHVASAQYVRILGKLSARLDTLGLGDIRLLGPDTASVSAATSDYMPALLADPTLMAKIEHFGLHDYGGNAGDAASAIAHSAFPTRTFWMTEYSAWCDGCDNGAPNPNDWDFAVGTLDFLFNYIEQGASSALIYDAYDSYYEHHGSMGYWGLLGYDATTKTYTPRKRFYTVAQVVKFARPGMIRIGVDSTDNSLRVFAFTDPATGALTIVGRNPNNAPETVHGVLAHLSAVSNLALYQTTQVTNMARAPDVPVSNGTFTAQIAPDSVFTLTSRPAGGSPAQAAAPTSDPVATQSAQMAASTLGNTVAGSATDNGDANYVNGSRFMTGASGGSVASMSVHVGSVAPAPNDQYELAIYTDHGGSPGSLVARSGRGSLVQNSWNTLPIHAALSPHTGYWLVYNTNGNSEAVNNMNLTPDDTVREVYSADTVPFGDWSSTFGHAVAGTGAFSIYATYARSAHSSASDPHVMASTFFLISIKVGLAIAAVLVTLIVVRRLPGVLSGCSRRLPWRV